MILNTQTWMGLIGCKNWKSVNLKFMQRRAFVVTLGSYGDVYPFLKISAILKELGFEVIFFANGYFERDAKSCALSFQSISPASDYEELLKKARPPHLFELGDLLAEYLVLRPLEETYVKIAQLQPSSDDVLVIHPLALGGRLIADSYHVPTIGCQLSPYGIPSVYDPAHLLPALDLSWLPHWLLRFGIRQAYSYIDRRILSSLNAFCRSIGVPEIVSVYPWVLNCDTVLGLFPDWFASQAPDWPKQILTCNFPLFEEAQSVKIPFELNEFLDDGDPPVIFTQGTPNAQAEAFFEAAAEVCNTLGLRGLFLAPKLQSEVTQCASHVIYCPMAPLELLIPRCKAVVHHGGIGTSARALHGGRPQVIVPWGVDQFDNARRIEKLGVGISISLRFFFRKRLKLTLERVLEEYSFKENAVRIADRMRLEQQEEIIKTKLRKILF